MMNMNQIMKQAKAMQDKVVAEQERLAAMEFQGASGGGMVKITITGKHDISSLQTDPSLLNPDDKEMLEDLIIAAYNDAKKKLDESSGNAMANMMGGMKLPAGFKMPL